MADCNASLYYASPEGRRPRPLWPAMVVALVGCPAACVAAAVAGCQAALGGGSLSPANLTFALAYGAIGGGLGGFAGAAFAFVDRPRAMTISAVATCLSAAAVGGSMYFATALAASC
jgi:hypothetical protein